MLRVTIDIFSGRPNPSWIVGGDQSASILREIALHRSTIGDPAKQMTKLGYRGVILELIQDHMPTEYNLPHVLSIACGTSGHEAKGIEIAQKLIDRAPFEDPNVGALPVGADAAAVKGAREFFVGQIASVNSPVVTTTSQADQLPAETMLPVLSPHETTPFAPEFWNAPSQVTRNNCYAYATNRRTDTFPQPGRASGRAAASFSFEEIAEAAMSDGAVSAADKVDPSEAPRYLAALFVWSGRDYHWYRLHSDRSWGHKPGPAPARIVDNAGTWIRDPRVCSCADYSDFCGFFLIPRNCTIR